MPSGQPTVIKRLSLRPESAGSVKTSYVMIVPRLWATMTLGGGCFSKAAATGARMSCLNGPYR
jgi:hypothetical protein